MNYHQKRNILVIDDDKEVLGLLEAILMDAHFEVKGIQYTNDIFGDIRDYQPGLVLMDYILTGINGGELCLYGKTI
jgi:DNA-binding response OmpR family regulator